MENNIAIIESNMPIMEKNMPTVEWIYCISLPKFGNPTMKVGRTQKNLCCHAQETEASPSGLRSSSAKMEMLKQVQHDKKEKQQTTNNKLQTNN